ncbi:glutathione S-transferase family protein [Sphingobium sp. YG1]|uniref:glutathione S-transferase family protein n=1 Tax=Sphingobium sp. YG1 TaxID=2082188 RepID=UPI000DBB8409|nr:glutathione S-transferase family protein [Sphingobium sp. YG1]BBD01500.1 glutathione S-transferase [Sphingobium sp. YG1]
MLTLYYSPVACSVASHVALEEAEADYRPHIIDVFKGEHLTPEYLNINPRAKVPALQFEDGSVLLESTAILSWIGLAYPEKKLLGTTDRDKADCISMCTWLSSTVHGAFGRWVRPERFADDAQSQAAVQHSAKTVFWQSLQEIDRTIGERDWLMGDQFTVCDTYALVFYTWAPELDLPVDDLTHFGRLKDQVLARPFARKVFERENSRLLTM